MARPNVISNHGMRVVSMSREAQNLVCPKAAAINAGCQTSRENSSDALTQTISVVRTALVGRGSRQATDACRIPSTQNSHPQPRPLQCDVKPACLACHKEEQSHESLKGRVPKGGSVVKWQHRRIRRCRDLSPLAPFEERGARHSLHESWTRFRLIRSEAPPRRTRRF